MILSTLHNNVRYIYRQPELAWYKRLIGMRYGPGWTITVDYGTHVRQSEPALMSPSPELVMGTLAELIDDDV